MFPLRKPRDLFPDSYKIDYDLNYKKAMSKMHHMYLNYMLYYLDPNSQNQKKKCASTWQPIENWILLKSDADMVCHITVTWVPEFDMLCHLSP